MEQQTCHFFENYITVETATSYSKINKNAVSLKTANLAGNGEKSGAGVFSSLRRR
jgi:hypothetical protein